MMLSTTLLSLLLLTGASTEARHDARRSRVGQHQNVARAHLSKRESGRMTYYDTSVGPGACGIVHQNSEWTVALNGEQLRSFGGGYPSPACGKQITISYGGKTAVATVQDECPSQYCSWGQLDLSPGLFTHFEPESTGVFTATWWFGTDGGSEPAPVTTTKAAAHPTTTTAAPPAETTSTSEAAPTTSTEAPLVEVTASLDLNLNVGLAAPTTSSAAPASSSIPASSAVSVSASAAQPSESEAVEEEDDESLPWCDELPDEAEYTSTSSYAPAPTTSSVAPSPTTTTVAAPAYTPPAKVTTTKATDGGWGNGGNAWVQPVTTAAAAVAAAPTYASEGTSSDDSAAVVVDTPSVGFTVSPIVVNASLVCPDPSSIVLLQNSTILFNNTIGTFVNFTRGLLTHSNSSLFTTTNVTLPSNGTAVFSVNGTSLIFNTTSLCYNSTLFPVANVSSWTNFTQLLFGNTTVASEVNGTNLLGLEGPINGGGNSTLGFIGFLHHLATHRRR